MLVEIGLTHRLKDLYKMGVVDTRILLRLKKMVLREPMYMYTYTYIHQHINVEIYICIYVVGFSYDEYGMV